MNTKSKNLLALGIICALTACGGTSATQEVTTAGKQKGGFLGLSEASDMTVDTGKAFAGVEEVIIGGFTVGFDLNKTDSVKAGGGLMGSGFGGKSTAHSELTGVSDAQMQAITDAAYKDFVAELKKQGIKVADRNELLQNKDFKDTKSYPVPYEDTQGGLLGGGTTTKYFAPSSFGNLRVFMGEIAGTMGGIGFSNPGMGAALFAEQSGKKVLTVMYHVNFANADSYGGWHTNSSAIKVGQGLSVSPGSRMGIIGGQGGTFSSAIGSISLGQPISSDKEFATVEDATSDANKAVQVATNVIGFVGGIGTNSSRSYTFKANPAKFKVASLEAIEKASNNFVAKMKELR